QVRRNHLRRTLGPPFGRVVPVVRVVSQQVPDRRDQQGMSGATKLEVTGRGDLRSHAVDSPSQPRLCAELVEVRSSGDKRVEILGTSTECVRQGEQDAVNLCLLVLCKRNDLIVER